MTLNQLHYFKRVAELQNYHHAAEELYVSQPSLSRSIASLEKELGVQLFEKSGRGIVLTKVGRVFLEYVDRIINECQVAEKKMKELSEDAGRIEIGYVFPLATHFIPFHCRQFLNKEENAKVTFNFFQSHTRGIMDRVKTGQLEIGFGGYMPEEEEFEFFPILEQEMVIITAKEHLLNKKKAVSIKELEKYPVIGYDPGSWLGGYTLRLYEQLGLHPSITIDCPDEYSIMAMVSENYGIALVPRVDALDDNLIDIHEISDIELVHHTFMFWLKDRYMLPASKRFIEYMKEISDIEEIYNVVQSDE